MRRWSWGTRAALFGGAALVVGVSAASAVPAAVEDWRIVTPIEEVPVELVAFDSCDTALTELRTAISPHVGVYGLTNSGFATKADGRVEANGTADTRMSAPQAANEAAVPEHSTTNAHEAGVDEPDLVKTDGKRVVTVVDGKLRVLDVTSRKVTGTLDVPAGPVSQLLLHGDRALVIGGGQGFAARGSMIDSSYHGEGASVTLVDLTGTPTIVNTLTVDGRYVDARQVDGVVRVVVHSSPSLPWVYPTDGRSVSESLIANRELVATAPIESWLPRYELTGADGSRSDGTLVACDRISHPVRHSATSMLSVLTFDFPGDLGSGDAVTIMADGDTVYGTGTSLYVADDHHLWPTTRAAPNAPQTQTTAIHQFDISQPGPPKHVASGQVVGTLLNQYSLSEHQGHLRVATTSADAPGIPEQAPATQSSVTVLKRDGAQLQEVGRIDGLGLGERIYSVRFVGPVGYVVTFRQVDPLYTLDLSDPTKPRKVGELKITGYSAYLHPAGDGKLIGVGQEATEQGRTTGTQVSLFDVSNPAAPTKAAGHHLAGANSEVEFDPHAFLYWPARDLVVLPVLTMPTAEKPATPISSGLLVLRLGDNAFSALGTVRHESATYDQGIRRALVIGDDLWTVSAAGVQVSRIDGLAQQAWVPFA